VKSAKPGTDTSGVELTNVSQHGLWLLIDGRERYLPYDQFPWFRHATIAQLSAIERPTPEHIRWPELDVDLTIESIDRPEDFPLVSRGSGDGLQP
jgi:hypothetical protein